MPWQVVCFLQVHLILGELKEAHGLRRADSTGPFVMQLQTYFTAFVANAKKNNRLVAYAVG